MKIFNWLLILFNNLNSLINWFCSILNPMPFGIMGGAQCKKSLWAPINPLDTSFAQGCRPNKCLGNIDTSVSLYWISPLSFPPII